MRGFLNWQPLKGWRIFFGEVGVVLLGVLLALGAQQIVEQVDKRQNRAFTEWAFRRDILTNAVNAVERLMIEPCFRARLAQLDTQLGAPGEPWRGNPLTLQKGVALNDSTLSLVYHVPNRLWDMGSWQTAVSNGVLTTMDRERVYRFAGIFGFILEAGGVQAKELELAPSLGFLRQDRRLGQPDRVAAQMIVARLDALNTNMVTSSRQLLDEIRAMRLGYSAAEVDAAVTTEYRVQRRYRGGCVRHLRLNL